MEAGINEKLMADVVSSIVEKILMDTGFQTYNMVAQILSENGITFADCFQKPDVLSLALRQVFNERFASIVEKISAEFDGLADDNHTLAAFLLRLRN